MATPTPTPPQILLALFSIFIISITAIADSSSSATAWSLFQDQDSAVANSSLFGPVLAKLGFRQFADAAESPCSTAVASWRGPTTIFAARDSSLLTCPSCSLPLLLREHTIPGLYTFHNLRKLAFGTKIETLASGRCITITSTFHKHDDNSSKVFIGGVEITRPDLFNDGNVIVHGLQGFVSHLSPVSCNIERMSSLSFPSAPPMEGFYITRLMLKDAMLRLRISGFSMLALALKVKYSELLDLRAMTVFALDDASIFAAGGNMYISDLRLHIVPNRRLMAADLESMRPGTVLPTMEWEQNLVVTTGGGGGPLEPMRINYAKLTSPDVIYNLKIAVHGVSLPFSRVNQTAAVDLSQINRCKWDVKGSEGAEACEMVGPTPGISPEFGDHRGFEI